uniref:DNA methyltransferase n=1 Tax=Gemmiger formicilis TaxID=745368 RepID=UPI003FF14B8F
MTETEKKKAATKFAADWKDRGNEKSDTQTFWMSLLRDVYGLDDIAENVEFEKRVKLEHTKFIDVYVKPTKVLVEQKDITKDLDAAIQQSDKTWLRPIEQLQRYAMALPLSEHPRWSVTCNFREFRIYDMEHPLNAPEVLKLEDLPEQYNRMNFLVDTGDENIKQEMAVSLKAGELVGALYDAILAKYQDPNNPETLRSLNKLCVRLVFCMYAEDAGLFAGHGKFHNYLKKVADKDINDVRKALLELFRILDTKLEDRDPYDDPELLEFPYVNGGLFKDEHIEIPRLDEHIIHLLLGECSEDFDWSKISPTIFGAVFESTLNPETRRSGGMHYTSIENIHKVIDPLFLDDLKAELAAILARPRSDSWRTRLLTEFQNKISKLVFFDPACGSGNFLTETYLSLRRLENEIIADQTKEAQGQTAMLGLGADFAGIKVSIGQFYGIEINDFAVTVARTALWIAESQMMKETEAIFSIPLNFPSLNSYTYIVVGNALRIDWETVVPKKELSYIMGNPPFVGYTYQSKEQKADLAELKTGAGKNIDYVAGWYLKAAKMIYNTHIRTAFVSTNSIAQGEQVSAIWKLMEEKLHAHIDFAHRTFRWDSEASLKAHVHCVIIGFSSAASVKPAKVYTGTQVIEAKNINAYLLDAPSVFIEKRNQPICEVPMMCKGSQPTDGGNLLFDTKESVEQLVKAEPLAAKYIREFVGADEFIKGKRRYCLWLVNANPSDLKKCPEIMRRVAAVRETRLKSTKAATRKQAETPTLFTEIRQPSSTYVVVPEVSSEKRRYVPIGFMDEKTVCSNLVFIVPEAELYHFGVITSNVHMAWMRVVCGRLKSDYRYSNTLVYNNFPWPTPTEQQKLKIEQTAQAILDARALYPDSSLADLYDELTMPPELRKAHQANDRAVMDAYGFVKGSPARTSESACVAELMKMYQTLTSK